MSSEKTTHAQSPTWIWVALFSTLASLCIHIYLYINHLKVHVGLSAESMCDLSEKFSCSAVAASKFSEILGIPLAALGAVSSFFLLIFLLMHKVLGSNSALKAFWLSLMIAGGSVVMAIISLTQMTVYCPFCIALYVLSAVIAISLWIHVKKFKSSEKISPMGFSGYLVAVVLLSWLTHAIVMQRTGFDEIEKAEASALQEWQANPQYDFSALNGIEFGSSADKSQLIITEFADFLCSHCQVAAPILHAFIKGKPNARLVFFTFPLDGCTAGPTGLGPSCKMAVTAFCAKEQGKGGEAHEWIFKNIVGLRLGTEADEKVNKIQDELGLNKDSFKKCYDSKDTIQSIQRFISAGKTAGVRGTPAIFANGRILPLAQRPTVLEKAYQSVK